MKLLNVLPQKQTNGGNDCTLVSMVTLLKYYLPEESFDDLYTSVRRALGKAYHPGRGTAPYAIVPALRALCLKYNLPFIPKEAHLKNIGYTYARMVESIERGEPFLLQLFNHPVYKSHTVTGYGYRESDRRIIIHDNWVAGVMPIKYDKLHILTRLITLRRSNDGNGNSL
jgi:hypothetical protein